MAPRPEHVRDRADPRRSGGKADPGVVVSRAWDFVGVKSFQALSTPLLIDSYAFQEHVLRSPLPAEMLPGLKPLGARTDNLNSTLGSHSRKADPRRPPCGTGPLAAYRSAPHRRELASGRQSDGVPPDDQRAKAIARAPRVFEPDDA